MSRRPVENEKNAHRLPGGHSSFGQDSTTHYRAPDQLDVFGGKNIYGGAGTYADNERDGGFAGEGGTPAEFSSPPPKQSKISRGEMRQVTKRAELIIRGVPFDPHELNELTAVEVLNQLRSDDPIPTDIEVALQRLSPKAQAFARTLNGWTVIGAASRSRLENYWRRHRNLTSNESISSSYIGEVKTLKGLISSLEGLSDVPIARDFAGALTKAAAQANPDHAIALLAKQLRAFDPTSVPSSIETTGTPTRLPDAAPALWDTTAGLRPSEFLTAHWQPFLDAGLLYQHHLRRLDPKLMRALDNQFVGQRDKLKALVPPKKAETEKLLSAHPNAPNSPGARRQLVAQLRRQG